MIRSPRLRDLDLYLRDQRSRVRSHLRHVHARYQRRISEWAKEQEADLAFEEMRGSRQASDRGYDAANYWRDSDG